LGGFKHEKCFTCHTDKQGPYVFEHLTSRVEGCTSCHDSAHGSVNRHMLSYQRVADLCNSCHTVVPGFHTRFVNTSQCTNCHSQIHGSNLHQAFLQ
jgi:predicted CXXCH cytochrome family protein